MTFTEKIEDILPEIDIDTGLMYCGDDEELFEEVVGEFIDGEMTASIEENYENENWKNYQIQVHAVKGTSLTIGAKKLHEEAMEIEQSVKKGDVDVLVEEYYNKSKDSLYPTKDLSREEKRKYFENHPI